MIWYCHFYTCYFTYFCLEKQILITHELQTSIHRSYYMQYYDIPFMKPSTLLTIVPQHISCIMQQEHFTYSARYRVSTTAACSCGIPARCPLTDVHIYDCGRPYLWLRTSIFMIADVHISTYGRPYFYVRTSIFLRTYVHISTYGCPYIYVRFYVRSYLCLQFHMRNRTHISNEIFTRENQCCQRKFNAYTFIEMIEIVH